MVLLHCPEMRARIAPHRKGGGVGFGMGLEDAGPLNSVQWTQARSGETPVLRSATGR
jgi:hypothetical protein